MAPAPKRATTDSADYGLYSAEEGTVRPHCVLAVSTDVGLQISYPKLIGKIYSRSSLSMLQIEVGAGVIDAGYRGIICVVLHNHSDKEFRINVADRIAQIVFEMTSLPVLTETLHFGDITECKTNGFGSTGK